MSKIRFKLFDSEAEVVKADQDSENELVIEFSDGEAGFVRIGELAERLSDGAYRFDLRLLENGEYTPELFLDDARITLPAIQKTGCLIRINDCNDGYIRAASQRERALQQLVLALEEKIKLLEDRVFGTIIL